MAKDKEEKKGAAIAAPCKKYVFLRDYDLFVSIKPNIKHSFKKDDVVMEKVIIDRLKSLQPSVIKAAD